MLLTTIRQAVSDRWPDTVDTDKCNRLIAAAVRYYSRFNPRILELTVTTVTAQKEYGLVALGATGIIGVQDVLWFPAGEASNEMRAVEEYYRLLREPPIYAMPSQAVIDDINESAHIARLGGKYRYEEAEANLIIYPEPTVSGSTFLVRYYATHALNQGATGYDTIPDADLDLLTALVIADLLDDKGNAAAFSPDYQEGLEKVSYGKVSGATTMRAEELRGRVAFKYGGTSVAVAP